MVISSASYPWTSPTGVLLTMPSKQPSTCSDNWTCSSWTLRNGGEMRVAHNRPMERRMEIAQLNPRIMQSLIGLGALGEQCGLEQKLLHLTMIECGPPADALPCSAYGPLAAILGNQKDGGTNRGWISSAACRGAVFSEEDGQHRILCADRVLGLRST
jgi:hypothetical protein